MQPVPVDALLFPVPRSGYPFRLFFAQKIATPKTLNWNANAERILERPWFAFSWKIEEKLRLAPARPPAEMVTSLLSVMA